MPTTEVVVAQYGISVQEITDNRPQSVIQSSINKQTLVWNDTRIIQSDVGIQTIRIQFTQHVVQTSSSVHVETPIADNVHYLPQWTVKGQTITCNTIITRGVNQVSSSLGWGDLTWEEWSRLDWDDWESLSSSQDIVCWSEKTGLALKNNSPNKPTILKKATTDLYYYVGGSLIDSVILRSPMFNNSLEVSRQRINRESIGKTRIVFSAASWPKTSKHNLKIIALTQAQRDDFFSFVKTSLGKPIVIIDHESQTWHGVITTPNSISTERWRYGGYSVQFEFLEV